MIELIGTIAGIVAVTGVVLNNYRLRACFLLWLASNTLSMGIHIHADLWSLAGRDMVFLALACHGWWVWTAILHHNPKPRRRNYDGATGDTEAQEVREKA